MKTLLWAIVFAVLLHAQHAEYLFTPGEFVTALAPFQVDSRGNLVSLEQGFALGLIGGFGTGPILMINHYTPDLKRIAIRQTRAERFAAGRYAVGLDAQDRLYYGSELDGRPTLKREGDWQMQTPAGVEGRVVAIYFADDRKTPVVLVSGNGRPALWQLDSQSGVIAKTFEFGAEGQSATALAHTPDGSVAFVAAGSTVFRISGLSRVDFQVQVSGGATRITSAAADASHLYVAGVSDDGGAFAGTPGAFQQQPPARAAAARGNPVAVVARLDPASGAILAGSYLGASVSEAARGIAIDESSGGVYVMGSTGSRDFPATGAYGPCGPDRGALGNEASFIVKLDPDLSKLLRSATFPFQTIGELPARTGADGSFFLRIPRENDRFRSTAVRFQADADPSAEVTCILGANYTPIQGLVPGQLLVIYGRGLGPPEPMVFDGQARFPREAAGVEVLIDGVAAPLLAVLNDQVNAMAPARLDFAGILEVRKDGKTVARRQLGVREAEPAPFLRVTPEGALVVADSAAQAVVENEDGSLNSVSNPAARGSVVSLFATGLGALRDVTPEQDVAGEVAAAPRDLRYVIDTASEFVEPEAIGTLPGRPKGVLRVRFRLPPDLTGRTGFTIAVKTLDARNQIPARPLPYMLFVQ